jgi:hypothetical protein
VSRNEIIETLYRSAFIDDVIQNITSGHRLNYLCINILKKQYHSSTSPFHNKWRKHSASNEIGDIKQEEEPENNRDIIIKIEHIVDTKLDIVDRELFKIYYKMDRYDRWIGDLRDTRCEKITSSYRKMERKLSLKGEPKITISRSTISLSHQRSIMIIKKELERYGISI